MSWTSSLGRIALAGKVSLATLGCSAGEVSQGPLKVLEQNWVPHGDGPARRQLPDEQKEMP